MHGATANGCVPLVDLAGGTMTRPTGGSSNVVLNGFAELRSR